MLRAFVSSFLLVACESESVAPRLGGARMLSAFPARAAASGWERVCDASAFEGLAVDVVLGDDWGVIAPAEVTLALDCLAPVGGACGAAAARVDAVRAVGGAATRVMLLVDRSAASDGPERAAPVVLAELGSDVRVGVLAFGEGLGGGSGMVVPCDAGTTLPLDAALASCTGVDRSVWRDVGTLPTAGRSNLWHAVDKAYDFLATSPGEAHIVVLTGGPDTCVNGETLDDCTSACSSVGPDDVMTRLGQDIAHPSGARITLHFVRWLAAGRPDPDARQMNAACVSGGQHLTVPEAAFAEASAARVRALVAGLDGTLRVAAEVDVFGAASSPPGELYRIDGELVITRGDDRARVPFGDTTPDALRLVKPCASARDCGGPTSACVIGCSPETGLCGHGAVLPDLARCGLNSFCCDGACNDAGACQACFD